jgi:hypothetical protein
VEGEIDMVEGEIDMVEGEIDMVSWILSRSTLK